MSLEIVPVHRLDDLACCRLDRVMEAARDALAGRAGHLDRIRARQDEARWDPHRWIYAAVQDGEAVGFADAEAHYPDLESVTVAQLAVERPQRHRGIGRALVQQVATRAQGTGIRWVAAHTRVRDADGFWTGLGFETTGPGAFRCPVDWAAAAGRGMPAAPQPGVHSGP